MSLLNDVQPADKINPATDLKLKVLLVGDSGTGKSTGATTLPGKKLLIDLDGRSESLAGFPNLDIIKIVEKAPNNPRAWLDLEALKEEIWSAIKTNKFGYDSLIVDGISAMCKISMNWSLLLTGSDNKLMNRSPGGGPAQPHYMPAMFRIDRVINSLLALPIHILFTAHVELFEDEHLKTLTYYPKITGKMRTEVANWFNESYLTKTLKGGGGNTKYIWLTQSTGDRVPFIKSSLNQLGKYWTDPIEVDFDQSIKGFEMLIEKRFNQELTKETKK